MPGKAMDEGLVGRTIRPAAAASNPLAELRVRAPRLAAMLLTHLRSAASSCLHLVLCKRMTMANNF